MKEDFIPLCSIGIFGWSVWSFYQGQTELAFYLLDVALFLVLSLGVVFIYSIDNLVDLIEKAIKHQEKISSEYSDKMLSQLASIANQQNKK